MTVTIHMICDVQLLVQSRPRLFRLTPPLFVYTPLLASMGVIVQFRLMLTLMFFIWGRVSVGVVAGFMESIMLMTDSSISLVMRPAVTKVGSVSNSMVWP